MCANRCRAWEHDRLRGVKRALAQDILRYLNKSPENRAAGDNLKSRLGATLTPQLLCLILYRLAHFLYVNGWVGGATLLSRFNFLVHKVSITPQSCIGPGLHLPHPAGVAFNGVAGEGLTLYSLAVCCAYDPLLDAAAEAGAQLGDRVTLGAHAVLLGRVTVGDDTRVAYSIRLDRDAPARTLVVSSALRVKARQETFSDGVG